MNDYISNVTTQTLFARAKEHFEITDNTKEYLEVKRKVALLLVRKKKVEGEKIFLSYEFYEMKHCVLQLPFRRICLSTKSKKLHPNLV